MPCVLIKTLCTTSSVSERGDMDAENQCGDPEHRITLCEINCIKSDNIDGYIIIEGSLTSYTCYGPRFIQSHPKDPPPTRRALNPFYDMPCDRRPTLIRALTG